MEFCIEDIEKEWSKDSKINLSEISESSSTNLELHSKYFKYINQTKKIQRAFEAERKKMVVLKNDYFLGNLPKETLRDLGWAPNQKLVLKTEIDKLIEADDDIINLNMNIGECNDIISFCESIIKNIQNKPFIIKNIIEDKKFKNGGY